MKKDKKKKKNIDEIYKKYFREYPIAAHLIGDE